MPRPPGFQMIYPTPSRTAEKRPPSLPDMFVEHRAAIGEALRRTLSGDTSVFDLLRYYMGWVDLHGNPTVGTEGKYLRPTLCLFACEATGGDREQAMPAAVAVELVHNFSLIHDDIQDEDATRHHRKTLWAVWGVPKALVAGNVLRTVADTALDDLQSAGVPPSRILLVVNRLTQAYLEMIEGQYLDISFEGRHEVGLNQYLDMIARKTGALIRSSFTMGALIGSRNDMVAEAFLESGKALGFIFQVRDDILGVWGDETSIGKPVGADIRRKKNSFPVVYAMAQARGNDKRRLLSIYDKDEPNDTDVADALQIMDSLNTRDYAHALAVEHGEFAMNALAAVELQKRARTEFEDLIDFLLFREH